jgi:hypothetical protein
MNLILKNLIISGGAGMSIKKTGPNPDIEKMDITAHQDLERFFETEIS